MLPIYCTCIKCRHEKLHVQKFSYKTVATGSHAAQSTRKHLSFVTDCLLWSTLIQITLIVWRNEMLSNTHLLIISIIILLLSSLLMGFFIFIIVSAKKDNRGGFYRLRAARLKIQELERETERTFGGFSYLFDKRIRTAFQRLRKSNLDSFSQTEYDVECGFGRKAETGCQTSF